MDSTLRYADPALNKSSGKRNAVTRTVQTPVSVVTAVKFSVSLGIVWQRLMFYEQIEKPPPWVLRLLLPIPVRTEGRELEVGEEIKCIYENGSLTKRVTRVTRGREFAFDVIEQKLKLHGGIKLSGGSYTLRELPDGRTEVALKTRYASRNRPRWLCRPVEAAVCHLFHRHILQAMRNRAESH
jgi:hypothetical protein